MRTITSYIRRRRSRRRAERAERAFHDVIRRLPDKVLRDIGFRHDRPRGSFDTYPW